MDGNRAQSRGQKVTSANCEFFIFERKQMTEKKLQHQIVMDWSQTHPDKHGNLWSTRNTTFSVRDGQTQKATGMIAGVSDLILYWKGRFVGIELKVRGSEHSSKHVQRQLDWGEKIIEAGGEWYIVTSLKEFWDVYEFRDVEFDFNKVRDMLKQGKSKIKF